MAGLKYRPLKIERALQMVTVFSFLISVINMTIGTFALSKGWEWFLVPLGVPEITFLHALGIFILFCIPLTVTNVLSTSPMVDKSGKVDVEQRLTLSIATILMYTYSLFFMWIVQLLIR